MIIIRPFEDDGVTPMSDGGLVDGLLFHRGEFTPIKYICHNNWEYEEWRKAYSLIDMFTIGDDEGISLGAEFFLVQNSPDCYGLCDLQVMHEFTHVFLKDAIDVFEMVEYVGNKIKLLDDLIVEED